MDGLNLFYAPIKCVAGLDILLFHFEFCGFTLEFIQSPNPPRAKDGVAKC